MNRKIIGILGLVGLVLTGCAAPEVETEQTMMGSYSSDEIMQDNGRKIEKHFQNEGEDGLLDINAVVDIPDISLKEGVIQSKEWDISMFGKCAVSRDRYDFRAEQSKRLYTLYWWICL